MNEDNDTEIRRSKNSPSVVSQPLLQPLYVLNNFLQSRAFACFVVGDVRDKKGNYYNFVGDTVEAFRAAGLHYYNEAILVTSVGSLPIRAGRQFEAGRKLGKTHQNVLVFVKGDGKKADCCVGQNEAQIS